MPPAIHTDVFVVGAGPAGLAAAIAARQHGLRATVVDHAAPLLDKACGEGLMPDSLAVARRLGLLLEDSDGASFQGIRFVDAEGSVAATFPRGHGLGIRRLRLHELLVQHAHTAGVQMLWRAQVSFASDGTAAVEGARVSCRWIVGADGQNSQVREWAGLAAGKISARRVAMRRHFRVRPWSEFVEIHWNNDGQAYVTPVGLDQVCVALISRERFLSFEDGLSGFPELAQRLDGAPPASTVRGALSISRRLLQVYRGNVALIGEASGSVDAITGEGIALAFRQALALAPALAASNLEAYAAAYRKIASLPEFMSRSMLLLDSSPGIRRRTLRAFEQDPELFSRMLAVHVGELQLKRYGIRSLLNLGWRILAA